MQTDTVEHQHHDSVAATFFCSTSLLLENNDLKARVRELEEALERTEAMWRQARDGRRAAETELEKLRGSLRTPMGE